MLSFSLSLFVSFYMLFPLNYDNRATDQELIAHG